MTINTCAFQHLKSRWSWEIWSNKQNLYKTLHTPHYCTVAATVYVCIRATSWWPWLVAWEIWSNKQNVYTTLLWSCYCICVFKSHIMDILFKASLFTEWKHNTTLVITNTCTHWCVQELVDCSARASHYQLITLHVHTVYMYALSTYIHMQHK